MPLQRVNVPITFQGGIDTKTDPKMVFPVKLSVLENGIFTKAQTISKRPGFTEYSAIEFPANTVIDTVNKTATLKTELVISNSDKSYSWSEKQQRWILKGGASAVETNSEAVVGSNDAEGMELADVAKNQNIIVYGYSDKSQSFYASIQDALNKTFYQQYTLLATPGGSGPVNIRHVSSGNYICVFYNGNGTNVDMRRLDVTNPILFTAPVTVDGAPAYVAERGMLDAAAFGTNIALTYTTGGGGNDFKLTLCDNAGTFLNSVTVADGVNSVLTTAVVTDFPNNRIYAFWYSTAFGLVYQVFNGALGTVLGKTVIRGPVANPATKSISAVLNANNDVEVYFDAYQTYVAPNVEQSDWLVYKAKVDETGVITPNSVLIRGVGLASKPYIYNGTSYVGVKTNYTLQATHYLLDFNGKISAKATLDAASPKNFVWNEAVSNVIQNSATSYGFAANVATKISNQGGVFLSKYNTTGIEFIHDSAKAQEFKEVNGNIIWSGGYPRMYDARSTYEFGFNTFPENISFALGGPGNIANGTYLYYATYEWTDAQGNIHRSAPSEPLSVTVVGGPREVIIYVPMLKLTEKTDVAIYIYRTEASGTIPYKVPTAALVNAPPVPNNPATDFATVSDVTADALLISGEVLYTTGDVVENIVPPAFKNIELFKNRVILSGLEDNKAFWFSKIVQQGEGVAFNDSFYVRVDSLGGPVNFCKTMDDKLIIFKDNLLFGMYGDGPTDSGIQDNFSVPQVIASDTGSSSPRSAILMPFGMMFKSQKGFYLLDRSLQLSYIGAEVEAYNDQEIVRATLHEHKNQVRFLTNLGSTLIYDYFFKQWSTATNHEGKDSIIYGEDYVYVRNDSRVWKEGDSVYTDWETGSRHSRIPEGSEICRPWELLHATYFKHQDWL